jgi:predicted transcriptional regulator
MTQKRKLTPAEWEIMEAVWELGRAASVRDVLDKAFPKGEKAYTTVQTVMNTLGLVNFYSPTRSKDDMIQAEMSSLISRVFDGSVPALANSLLSLDNLSLEEVREIKKLLRRKEQELKGERS